LAPGTGQPSAGLAKGQRQHGWSRNAQMATVRGCRECISREYHHIMRWLNYCGKVCELVDRWLCRLTICLPPSTSDAFEGGCWAIDRTLCAYIVQVAQAGNLQLFSLSGVQPVSPTLIWHSLEQLLTLQRCHSTCIGQEVCSSKSNSPADQHQ
jgi:hypothetical protein